MAAKKKTKKPGAKPAAKKSAPKKSAKRAAPKKPVKHAAPGRAPRKRTKVAAAKSSAGVVYADVRRTLSSGLIGRLLGS